jgi:hypothetical protein
MVAERLLVHCEMLPVLFERTQSDLIREEDAIACAPGLEFADAAQFAFHGSWGLPACIAVLEVAVQASAQCESGFTSEHGFLRSASQPACFSHRKYRRYAPASRNRMAWARSRLPIWTIEVPSDRSHETRKAISIAKIWLHISNFG